MLTVKDLPVGSFPKALDFIHFPTRFQGVIFRNWNTVPFERIAKVLGCTKEDVINAGKEMGLVPDERYTGKWDQRGFLTTIRRNWQLLPYDQLLTLLDWTPEKLHFALREEDFLYYKMGLLKPDCEEVKFRALTDEEKEKTAKLRESLLSCHAGEEPEPWSFLAKQGKLKPMFKQAEDSFGIRLVHSYSALFGDALLDPDLDPYPEAMLADYQASGINAIWMQGTLYTLIPWLGTDEYSDGAAQRCEALRKLTEKAAKYGIRLFLYMNEPRNMPKKFFEKRPEWQGEPDETGENFAICTETPGVLEALRDGLSELFRQVPLLGGVLTITMSENLTHCHSRKPGACDCPRCKDKPVWQFPVSVLRAIEEGIHRVKPEADIIAWTWAWDPEWVEDAVKALPKSVKVMCVSESRVPTEACGVKGFVRDYSISKVGPGELAKKTWQLARRYGLETMAKTQLNCTWEGSFTPYLPVPSLVEQHLNGLRQEKVEHLMAAWTLGGFPGGNLPLVDATKEELAEKRFGKDAQAALEAQQYFADGFKEFPFHETPFIYTGPQNFGPAALFYPEKTNYEATMVGFPYDDMYTWSGNGYFTPEILIHQFELMTSRWRKGLDILDNLDGNADVEDLTTIAHACYCHFNSTLNHLKFVYYRDRGEREKLPEIIRSERQMALELFELQRKDDRIGFESSNHYFYFRNELLEKVLCCDALLEYFA
ncbi:MAG: hypothetical protein IKC65_06500 [Lentisphaeria bacterium]|nr:hypothetical protein [Lentisphaeria bacterium]